MKQKYLIRIAALILILIGFYFTYSYFFLSNGGKKEIGQEQIGKNIENILESLSFIENLGDIDARNGFWYESSDMFGEGGVFYFSLLDIAKKNLSESELDNLYRRIKESRTISRNNMRFVPEKELPDRMQFYNGIYSFSSRRDSKIIKEDLDNKLSANDYKAGDLWKLEYLSGLEGNYKERDRLRARNCEEFGERCANENINIKIKGIVADGKNNPIQSAKVESVIGYGLYYFFRAIVLRLSKKY